MSADSNTETNEKSSSPKPTSEIKPSQNTISRRDFLKKTAKYVGVTAGVMAGVDSIVAHTPATAQEPSFTKAFWEKLETGTLNENPVKMRDAIEKEFTISLRAPSTGQKDIQWDQIVKKPLLEWDTQTLKTLAITLSRLPRHFYEPFYYQGKEHPLEMALTHSTSDVYKDLPNSPIFVMDVSHRCECGESHINEQSGNRIVFERPFLGETVGEQKNSSSIMVHELTHYLTLKNLDHYKKTVAASIGIVNAEDLGNIFENAFAKGYDPIKNPVGYGALDIREFFSVAAQLYFQGKAKFSNEYLPYLGQEKTSKLYDSVKQEIFSGKEY